VGGSFEGKTHKNVRCKNINSNLNLQCFQATAAAITAIEAGHCQKSFWNSLIFFVNHPYNYYIHPANHRPESPHTQRLTLLLKNGDFQVTRIITTFLSDVQCAMDAGEFLTTCC
jgi:hypothetical protein